MWFQATIFTNDEVEALTFVELSVMADLAAKVSVAIVDRTTEDIIVHFTVVVDNIVI